MNRYLPDMLISRNFINEEIYLIMSAPIWGILVMGIASFITPVIGLIGVVFI